VDEVASGVRVALSALDVQLSLMTSLDGPHISPAGAPASTTLSNAGFSNPAANTDNLFFAKATFTPPTACTLDPGDNAFVNFGGEIDSNTQVFGGGGPFTAGDPASIVQLGVASATALGAGPHTLTLTFNTNCTGSGQHGSITNIELDTAAIG
jgi:hypothetical protein